MNFDIKEVLNSVNITTYRTGTKENELMLSIRFKIPEDEYVSLECYERILQTVCGQAPVARERCCTFSNLTGDSLMSHRADNCYYQAFVRRSDHSINYHVFRKISPGRYGLDILLENSQDYCYVLFYVEEDGEVITHLRTLEDPTPNNVGILDIVKGVLSQIGSEG